MAQCGSDWALCTGYVAGQYAVWKYPKVSSMRTSCLYGYYPYIFYLICVAPLEVAILTRFRFPIVLGTAPAWKLQANVR